jgi:hypothetical protein
MVGRRYASQKTSIYFWKITEQMTFQLRNGLIAWELILESDSWWETKPPFNPSLNQVRLCPSSLPPASLSPALVVHGFFGVAVCGLAHSCRSSWHAFAIDYHSGLRRKGHLLDSPFFSENVDVENSKSFLFFCQLGTEKEKFWVLDRSKALDVEYKIYNTYRDRRVKGEHLPTLLII